jgi:hypothetical protein
MSIFTHRGSKTPQEVAFMSKSGKISPAERRKARTESQKRKDAALLKTSVVASLHSEVYDHVSTKEVLDSYKGKGVRGRPPLDQAMMGTILLLMTITRSTCRNVLLMIASSDHIKSLLCIAPYGDNNSPCYKTLYNFMNKMKEDDLLDKMFAPITAAYIKDFINGKVVVRGDGTFLHSWMKDMRRFELFFTVIRRFLVALKKGKYPVYQALVNGDPDLLRRYGMEKEGKCCFSMATKWKRAGFILKMIQDTLYLAAITKDNAFSGRLPAREKMVRALNDQCDVDTKSLQQVNYVKIPKAKLKDNKDVLPTALQSPSDPDAAWSGHKKAAGFTGAIVEAVPLTPGECGVPQPRLILGGMVLPANFSDSVFFEWMLKTSMAWGLDIAGLLLDAAFGSQENYELAKSFDIEMYSPVNANTPTDEVGDDRTCKLPLDMFERDSSGSITACPRGAQATTTSMTTSKGLRFRCEFDLCTCQKCPVSGECRVRLQKKAAVMFYTPKAMGLAIRRTLQKEAWWQLFYRPRSGVEGTIQKLKWLLYRMGFGCLSVRGLKNVSFEFKLGCYGLNYLRIQNFKKKLANAKAKA